MQTGTDYGPYLANEAPPLQTAAIVDCCTRRLADVWHDMRCNADEPLATFLDYCTYGHMIDNVVLIVTGLLHERDVQVRRSKLSTISGVACSAAAREHRHALPVVPVPCDCRLCGHVRRIVGA